MPRVRILTRLRNFALAAISTAALFGGAAGAADTKPGVVVIAAQTLRPGIVLDERHVTLAQAIAGPGDLTALNQALGQETRVAVYRGHAIRAGDLGPPTIVRRNDLVHVVFRTGPLRLETEGRVLDDGALGSRVRVMNLDSRRTVYGVVAGPGLVETR